MKMRERGPYKKLLSIFEIDELAQVHATSPIFLTNRKGERILDSWLKELRFNQAIEVAQIILGSEINEQEFGACWKNTPMAQKKRESPSAPPNTATFGGYRLGSRSSLNRDKKQKPRPKKK